MQEDQEPAEIEPLTKKHARLLIALGVPFLLISPWVIIGVFTLIMDLIDGRIMPGEFIASNWEGDIGRKMVAAMLLFLGGVGVWFDYRAIARGTCSIEMTKRIWIRSIVINSLWILFFAGWTLTMLLAGEGFYGLLLSLIPIFFVVVSIKALVSLRRQQESSHSPHLSQ